MTTTPVIVRDYDLTAHTTFGIPVRAAMYAEYSSVPELIRLSRTPEFMENEVLHMGGGSNLLFVRDFDGLVLHSAIKGITRYDKDEETVFAIAGAGEKWTDFVDWCVANGLGGVENMAGIPGEVGASAVQNVGAYGVEAKDVIHSVECFDTVARKTRIFKADECRFGYRDSFFKHDGRGRYYVLRVGFRLRRNPVACHLEYGSLASLADRLGHQPDIAEVKAEVERLRAGKLPDPEVIGSAGSFFKNPVINRYYFEEEVLARCADVPFYDIDDKRVKVPAGWLIEHAGLKGARIGGAEVYPRQCLVIANAGGATAADVVELAGKVTREVNERFGILLSPEVNYIDTGMSITVLGSGTSKGVPEIGCGCRVCRSADSRDKRQRASVMVRTRGLDLLIDASPDLRCQALANGINHIDAVLLTHQHYDHVGGVDDLRPFCINGSLPIIASRVVDGDLRRRLDYCFREHLYPGVPRFDMRVIDGLTPVWFNGVKIIPVRVMHGRLPILGYRIGDFAYITDAKTIEESEKEKLRGLKVLVINALRRKEHFAHLSLDEALALIDELKPDEAYLTHFSHEMGLHADLERQLPPHVHAACDGLRIEI